MVSEKIKYQGVPVDRSNVLTNLPSIIIDPFTTEDLVEEVWLTGNKDDAICILETYANKLTNYSSRLLYEIIFGIEFPIEYQPEKFTKALKIHQTLDRILF